MSKANTPPTIVSSRYYSNELEELVPEKLPRNQPASGRLSPVGVTMTLLEASHIGALLLMLPGLLLERTLCAEEESCSYASSPLCDSPLSRAPWWLVHLLLIEAVFYIVMRTKLAYMQSVDPQEAYFKAANILTLEERQVLWDRVMKAEAHNVAAYFEAWFFDTPMEQISKHEVQNFITWCYFDGCKQEHLSDEEIHQLGSFVEEALEQTKGRKVVTRKVARAKSFDTAASTDADIDLRASWLPCHEEGNPRGQFRRLEAHQCLLNQTLATAHNTPEAELARAFDTITRSHKKLQCSAEQDDALDREHCRRFGRPTADPLLGVKIFPLLIHLTIFLTTQLPCDVLLWLLGFSKDTSGSVSYYYHSGKNNKESNDCRTPLVFIHGIGVGPIVYLPLLWQMLNTGRPIFVPEVTSVSAFRPWVMPSGMKTPEQVATSLSLMLASHGFARATFSGHSFGTFWMTYMVKYAPDFVESLVFMDPVNFCLYNSLLTRSVVYNTPDPGDIGYMIKTDMMVNWSVQRNFSWVRGNLFVEDIGDKPYAVFLSGDDKVAPSKVQEAYLKKHTVCSVNPVDIVTANEFEKGNSVNVFSGCDHGMWMLNSLKNIPKVVEAMEVLTKQAEKQAL